MTLASFLLIVFFVLTLLIRKISGKDICALCVSVSLTWVSMFILMLGGIGQDKIVLGILMGGSAVGFVYYFSSRSSETFKLLKFPLLVSLFWLVYLALSVPKQISPINIVFLGGLWFLFGFIFFLYKNNNLRALGKRL
ncbi:MAG: hypothetical protein CO184_01950, partial [Candidatus Zambryskibacteria bacterium CG_4_9_14_3_um_filter_40_16]